MDFIGEGLKWFDRFRGENAEQDEKLPTLRAVDRGLPAPSDDSASFD